MRGRLKGGTIVKASLIGTCCWFCKRPMVSTSPGGVRDSGTCRDLRPIITKGYPSIWKCLMGCLSVDGVDFGCCVYTPRFDKPVRCDTITFIFSTNNLIWQHLHSPQRPPSHRRLRNRGTAWCTEHIFICLTTTHFSKYLFTIDCNTKSIGILDSHG